MMSYYNNTDIDIPPFLLQEFFQFYHTLTLKNIIFNLLHNILLSTTADKITLNIYQIVDVVLSIITAKRTKPKIEIIESVTDLLARLMEKAHHYIVKNYRKEISEMFFNDSFFSTSARTLNNWATIINLYMNHEKNELIEDIFYKWNTSAGMFTSKKFETQQKVIAIKRVAFLLFASETDRYLDKIDSLLKKITEHFKMGNLDKKVRVHLLLLCRVLLLRLSDETLTESLRKLWPNLLNELVSIFEAPRTDEDSVELVMEAFKLVELLSLLNLEDFQQSQWIFLLDHFNVTSSFREPEDTHSSNFESFTPMITQFTNEGVFEISQKEDLNLKEDISTGEVVQNKSKIQIAQGDMDFDEDTLYTIAKCIQTQAGINNQERTNLDISEAEAMIEADFIDN